MNNQFLPQTKSGTWSVGLYAVFVIAVAAAITLVLGLNWLDFGDTWWDVSVAILLVISLTALALAIIARTKYQDRSISVLVSLLLGILVIIFLFIHSLFIND